MNTIFSKHISFLLSLATFAAVGTGLPAQAETIDTASTDAPVPGTTATLAAALTQAEPFTSQLTPAAETADSADSKVAQIDIDPGTPTLGGNSYIGIAGNIGLGGNTALGDTSFMAISKIGLTTNIAVRPSVLIEDDPVILIPATFDFSIQPVDAFTEVLPIAPYVGAGVAITTGDGGEVGPLVTAGVDVPLTPQFTATAAVNAAFLDDTEVGLVVGVGYNFTGLGL